MILFTLQIESTGSRITHNSTENLVFLLMIYEEMKSCEHQNLHLKEIKDNWVIWWKPQRKMNELMLLNTKSHKLFPSKWPTCLPVAGVGDTKAATKLGRLRFKGLARQGNLLQRCQRGKKVNGTLNNVNNCNHTPKQMSTVQNVHNPTYCNKKNFKTENYILKEWRLSVEMVKKQNKYWMKAYGSLLMLS